MLPRIKELAATLAPRLIAIRRDIHSHPEISGQEQISNRSLCSRKKPPHSSGVRAIEGIGKQECSANSKATAASPGWAGTRTDMDALPIKNAQT